MGRGELKAAFFNAAVSTPPFVSLLLLWFSGVAAVPIVMRLSTGAVILIKLNGLFERFMSHSTKAKGRN